VIADDLKKQGQKEGTGRNEFSHKEEDEEDSW